MISQNGIFLLASLIDLSPGLRAFVCFTIGLWLVTFVLFPINVYLTFGKNSRSFKIVNAQISGIYAILAVLLFSGIARNIMGFKGVRLLIFLIPVMVMAHFVCLFVSVRRRRRLLEEAFPADAKEKQGQDLMTDKIKSLAFRSLILAGILGCLFIFASWFSVSKYGNDTIYTGIFYFITLFVIAFFGSLLYVIFGLVGVVLHLKVPDRATWKNTAVCCVIFFPCIMVAICIGLGIRDVGFRAIATRGEPLVKAIQKYQATNGLPPAKLDDLVPKYISSIPHTGVGAYPEYIYVTNGISSKYEGNPWILVVPISSDTEAAYDLLVYFPNQQYPTNKYGDMGRVGKWRSITVDKSRAHTDGYAFDATSPE